MTGLAPPSTWLDFLLDSSLLETHIAKPGCMPTAPQLIIQFLQQANAQAANGPNNQKAELNGDAGTPEGDRVPTSKRVTALKVLALKTAAYLSWNLELLEESIPPLFLLTLLLELVRQVSPKSDSTEDLLCPSDVSEKPDQVVFALQLYHRWCVRTLVKEAMPVRPVKTMPMAVPGLTEPLISQAVLDEDKMNELRNKADVSMEVLRACLIRGGPILVLGPGCFVMPTEMEQLLVGHDFSKMTLLTERDYVVPLCFDMGSKYFLDGKYSDAAQVFEQCSKHSASTTKSTYASVDGGKLAGYLAACRAILGQAGLESASARLEAARAAANWKAVVQLLAKDVVSAELPSSIASSIPREAMAKGCPAADLTCIRFCCDLRAALRNEPTLHLTDLDAHADSADVAAFMLQVLESVTKSADFQRHSAALRSYVRYQLSRCAHSSAFRRNLLSSTCCAAVFSDSELTALRKPCQQLKQASTGVVPGTADGSSSSMPASALPSRTDAADEKQIYFTYDDMLIKWLMLKLHKQSPHFLKNVCESWKLPKDLARGFNQLNSGFEASYCFVLTAKSRECLRMQEFATAKVLLGTAERLAKDISAKLSKLLRWEMLYVDLLRCRHDSLTAPEEQLLQQNDELIKKVKTCLTVLKSEAEIYPGEGLIQECVIFLLNARDWDYVSSLTKSNVPSVEFSRLLAETCKEQAMGRGTRAASRALWDAVVQVHSEGSSLPRRDGGLPAKMARQDDAGLPNKERLKDIAMALQEPTVLSLLLGLFSRLYNVAKGDAVISLPNDVASIWPNSLDKITVDAEGISIAIEPLLAHALAVYPQNSSWLRMQADIYYAAGNYTGSMRYYLEAGAVATKFFSEPPPRHVFDDQVYRRLIKCCLAFRCHTQAAVMCQFLDEVDYTMAFKCLQERNACDATDAYYSCIWDVSILEFLVNLHCKRGEVEKKQTMLNLIGQQELNSCNGDSLLLRAANIRKVQFLTMLAQQYLNSHSEYSLPAGAMLL